MRRRCPWRQWPTCTPTNPPLHKMPLWKTVANRPASGRSFLIVIVLAALAAIAVTIWTFWSAGKTPRHDGAAGASFKI